jgi:hypothetical protein
MKYQLPDDKFTELKTNISKKEFDELTLRESIKMNCRVCNCIFTQTKNIIVKSFKNGFTSGFCSRNCSNKFKKNEVTTQCKECEKEIIVSSYRYKNNSNCFCSYYCGTKHRNKNKTSGYKRSKIEFYIEEKIKTNFPLIELKCNETKTLEGLELDFYFPSLKLAFELNGITHYEPIYGIDRLERSKDSDKRKMAKCMELGIELAIIDISRYKYFTEKSGEIVFQEIEKIISPLYQYQIKHQTKL